MVNELYEYTIDKKSEGNYKLARLGMVFLYVLFGVAFFVACYVSGFVPVFALAPIFIWMLEFFTWRYVSIEYKYTVEAGILKLIVIYGGKTQKEKASFRIKEAAAFVPLHEALDEIKIFSSKKTYNFLSSMKSAKDPYAFMIIKDGVRTVAMIEAPEPSRKAILYYATDEVRAGKLVL